MTIGDNIQYYRKQKNLSQEQLGELLFVSRQTVSQWEKNQTQPTIDNLLKLSEIFGVSVDAILTDNVEEKREQADGSEQPMESFSVSYRYDDLRRAVLRVYKGKMIRMTVVSAYIIVLFLVVFFYMRDVFLTGFTFGVAVFCLFLTAANFLKIFSVLRAGEKRSMNRIYLYEIFQNSMNVTMTLDGAEIGQQKIPFSDISKVFTVGDLLVFQFMNQLFILHDSDLAAGSHLRSFLLTHTGKKKQ